MSIYDKYPPEKTVVLIRDLMKALDITGTELARRARLAPSTISRILAGKRRPGMDVYTSLTGIARFVFRD